MRSTSLLLIGLIALLAAPAAPASADIGPPRDPCLAPGEACVLSRGDEGVCFEFTCTPDYYPLGSTRLSPTSCVECRPPSGEAPERLFGPDGLADSLDPPTEPPADVTPDPEEPDPEEPAPSGEGDSFFGCAAHGVGAGLLPLGPLGFVALAWSVLFTRRRRGR